MISSGTLSLAFFSVWAQASDAKLWLSTERLPTQAILDALQPEDNAGTENLGDVLCLLVAAAPPVESFQQETSNQLSAHLRGFPGIERVETMSVDVPAPEQPGAMVARGCTAALVVRLAPGDGALAAHMSLLDADGTLLQQWDIAGLMDSKPVLPAGFLERALRVKWTTGGATVVTAKGELLTKFQLDRAAEAAGIHGVAKRIEAQKLADWMWIFFRFAGAGAGSFLLSWAFLPLLAAPVGVGCLLGLVLQPSLAGLGIIAAILTMVASAGCIGLASLSGGVGGFYFVTIFQPPPRPILTPEQANLVVAVHNTTLAQKLHVPLDHVPPEYFPKGTAHH